LDLPTAKEIEAGPLVVAPAEPPLPFKDLLYAERQELKQAGYSFRIPRDWGNPAEAELQPGSDIILSNVEGDSLIIIGRKTQSGVEHYGHWVKFREAFEASIKAGISEVRIEEMRPSTANGLLSISIDHLFPREGAMRFSRKVAVWAGGEVILINFETANTKRAERLPVFEAFVGEFRLIDPGKALMPDWPLDYVGEIRDPGRELFLPIPRGARPGNLPKDTPSVFARYVMPPLSITLGEHFHTEELLRYGDFQRDLLAKTRDIVVYEGGPVTPGERFAYRIEFSVGPKNRSVMYIYKARDRFYQLIFGTDPESWPYLAALIGDMAAQLRFPAA